MGFESTKKTNILEYVITDINDVDCFVSKKTATPSARLLNKGKKNRNTIYISLHVLENS